MNIDRKSEEVNKKLNDILIILYSTGITDPDFEVCWKNEMPELSIIAAKASTTIDIKREFEDYDSNIIERVYYNPLFDLLRLHNNVFLPIAEIVYCALKSNWSMTPIPPSNRYYQKHLFPLEKVVLDAINKTLDAAEIESCDLIARVSMYKSSRRIFVGELQTMFDENNCSTLNTNNGLFIALFEHETKAKLDFLRVNKQYYDSILNNQPINFIKNTESYLRYELVNHS